MNGRGWAAAGVLGIVGAAVAALLYLVGLAVLALAHYGNVLTLTVPVFRVVQTLGGITIIGGVVLGAWSYREKNWFHDWFFPVKSTVLIAFLLAVTGVLALRTVYGEQAFLDLTTYTPATFSQLPFLILLYTVLLYPFTAVLYGMYTAWQDDQLETMRIFLVLLLILFNPVVVAYAVSISGALGYDVTHKPCDATVTAVTEHSPAAAAGMKTGERITAINNTSIETVDALRAAIQEQGATLVTVTVDADTYTVTPAFNETAQRYRIGVRVTNAYCKTD